MHPRYTKERAQQFNEEFQRIQKTIYTPFDPPTKPSNKMDEKEYQKNLEKYKKEYDLEQKLNRGNDLKNLFERFIESKETEYITKEHIEAFVSTFPGLINKSYTLTQGTLIQHITQLLQIEEHKYHDLFILSPKIQETMLSLPVDTPVVSLYTGLFFPTAQSTTNTPLYDEEIDLKDFKNNIEQKDNQTIITIDSNPITTDIKDEKKSSKEGLSLNQLKILVTKYPDFFNSIQNLTINLESKKLGLTVEKSVEETLDILAKSSITKITFQAAVPINDLEDIKKMIERKKITTSLNLASLLELKPDKSKLSYQKRKKDFAEEKRQQAESAAKALANTKYLEEINIAILRNRRELNKQKLKSLATTEEKIQSIAKEIIRELPEKFCSCLNFSAFHSPDIEAALIDLLKKGNTKTQLAQKLFDFIQLEKSPGTKKTNNIFNNDLFNKAYKNFLDNKRNQQIRKVQADLLYNASAQRWNKTKDFCEKGLGLKETLAAKDSAAELTFMDHLASIIHTLKYDAPSLEQLTQKDSKELNTLATMLLTFIVTGTNPLALNAILKLNILNQIDIDALLNNCSALVEVLEEKLKQHNIKEFYGLKQTLEDLDKKTSELSTTNTKKTDLLIELQSQFRQMTTSLLTLENRITHEKKDIEAANIKQRELEELQIKYEQKQQETRIPLTELSEKIQSLKDELSTIEKTLSTLNQEIRDAKIKYTKLLDVIRAPLAAVENFPVLKSALEKFNQEKRRLKKQGAHPYKIAITDKQDFQIQQQQQHNASVQKGNPANVSPTSPLLKGDEEQLAIWLGHQEHREIKTITENAFNILKEKKYIPFLKYGIPLNNSPKIGAQLPLNNLPKGFFINATPENILFLDYDPDKLLQDNKNFLTQELPIDRKITLEDENDFFIENDAVMLQFHNSKESDNNITFSEYVKNLLKDVSDKEATNLKDKFIELLDLEDKAYHLKQGIPIKHFNITNIKAAAKLIYTYGNDGIEFLFNKINNITRANMYGSKGSEIFIKKFLNPSQNWAEFTTLPMAIALDRIASFSSNQMRWWNKLSEQHNQEIGTSLPDLVNAFTYFIEQFKLLTNEKDLPENCSLNNVDNMKTGLTRYLYILTKDPTKRPDALDIDTYNALQQDIEKTTPSITATLLETKPGPVPSLAPRKEKTELKNPAEIKERNRGTLSGEKRRQILTEHFASDINVDEIVDGIRHLNINSSSQKLEKPTLFDPEEELKSVEEDTEDDTVVIRDIPQAPDILEKISLIEAYHKVNSWGHESSRILYNIHTLHSLDDDAKNIFIKDISDIHGRPYEKLNNILRQHGLNFPISLYELNKKIHNDPTLITAIQLQFGDKFPSFHAIIATIPKAITNMASEELKKYATECREQIKTLTQQQREGKDTVETKKQLINTKLFYLALLREGLYRIDPKARFANSTQVLSVINETIINEGNSFAQISTGQGKSLITALSAAMLAAEGNTVDIITSDPHLANEGVKEFSDFFTFFNIDCADRAIEADDYLDGMTVDEKDKCVYKKGGINYADITSMAVFRARMQLELKTVHFAGPVSAILDEADYIAEFPTTIRYVKTNNTDSTSTHKWLYQLLNDFIDDPEYDNLDHIADKRKYLLEKATQYIQKNVDAKTIDALLINEKIDILSEAQIDKWLAAAWNAKHIAETGFNKTFKIATQIIGGNTYSVVHHIINNKESEHAQLMNGGQQFLHARMEKKLKHPHLPAFWFAAENPALTSVKSIDFIEYYRSSENNPGGKIKGHTGFIGDQTQLDIIASRHNIQSTAYPSHQKKQRIDDQGIFLDEKILDKEIFLQIKRMIQEKRPILLLCKNAEEAKKMAEKIQYFKNTNASMARARINLYTALDKKSMEEKSSELAPHEMDENQALEYANEDCTITISDASLGRGKDFKPKHPQGLHVILNYLGTQADIEQGIGRAGRQGNKGSSFHGVTKDELIGINIDLKMLPLRTDHKNKRLGEENRILIADLFKKSRENKAANSLITNLFDEAFSNISRYFSELFLELKDPALESNEQKYKNFLLIQENIWKNTLDKNIDFDAAINHDYNEELKKCFDSALKEIWHAWPFDKTPYDLKEAELKAIQLPIRNVKPPNFSADLAPATNAIDFSSIALKSLSFSTLEEEQSKLSHTVVSSDPTDLSDRDSKYSSKMDTKHSPSETKHEHKSTVPVDALAHTALTKPLSSYQLIKRQTLRDFFRPQHMLPNDEVLRYVYLKIIEARTHLKPTVPFTINETDKCFFEAYILISNILNIKINNETNYLSFVPTDKQRAYLEKCIREKFVPPNVMNPEPSLLSSIKKRAYSDNVFGAFDKNSTLPLSELDLLLLEAHNYIRMKLPNGNIPDLSPHKYQIIIDQLNKYHAELAILSRKERLSNSHSSEHHNEIIRRDEYRAFVIDFLQMRLNEVIARKKSHPLDPLFSMEKTTALSSSAKTLEKPSVDTSHHKLIKPPDPTTKIISLKHHQFKAANISLSVERNLVTQDTTRTISPTDIEILQPSKQFKSGEKIINQIKKNNKEILGEFTEEYHADSYHIVNQFIADKHYQTIKGQRLFGTSQVPNDNVLACAYTQLLTIKEAFKGTESKPLIEITTKDECMFKAYILVCTYQKNEFNFVNKTSFSFEPTKEQIQYTQHFITASEQKAKKTNIHFSLGSWFSSHSAQQKIDAFAKDLNKIQNEVLEIKTKNTYDSTQRKNIQERLQTEYDKLVKLSNQLAWKYENAHIATQAHKQITAAEKLLEQIQETITQLDESLSKSSSQKYNVF